MPDTRTVAGEMADAAVAFLASLDDAQRPIAALDFDDGEARRDWGYFPRPFRGIPLLKMSQTQAKRAHALVVAGLSLHAYARVNAIIALEQVLDEIERRIGTLGRDPGRYFLAIFGAPDADGAPWSWRFEGHHVSLNFTLAGGDVVAATPSFLGANPSEVLHGTHAVVRPCAEEEDLARALLLSLDGEQRAIATICDVAPPDFVLTNVPRVPAVATAGEFLPDVPVVRRNMQPAWDAYEPHKAAIAFAVDRPLGLAASRMDAHQRALLDALIAVYVDRLAEPLAAEARASIARDGIDGVHFAWAGSEKRREGHYYRLQGGRLLIEYDNTQDGANHVHAVWRDTANDFGEDALRAHLRAAH